jgi:hypothetical protein
MTHRFPAARWCTDNLREDWSIDARPPVSHTYNTLIRGYDLVKALRLDGIEHPKLEYAAIDVRCTRAAILSEQHASQANDSRRQDTGLSCIPCLLRGFAPRAS